jgi:hypothetical protein
MAAFHPLALFCVCLVPTAAALALFLPLAQG